ncbi:MAG: DUF1302 family protein [Deltaproteobacteria bacterium]|nr:DUF1302 family protein [Deltaproteobacteria bacterium]
MRWMKTVAAARVILSFVLVCGLTRSARAIYLDDEQNISIRARVYSQASVRLPNSVFTGDNQSQTDTVPTQHAGQLVAQRNFYNPEIEAKILPYASVLKPVADDLSFRFAAWGFYDGVYDWGAREFRDSAAKINANYPNPTIHAGAFFLEGENFAPPTSGTQKKTVEEIFPGVEAQNPRDIYGHRQRVNELYLNYSKGPVFVRIGRQAISWGESDTIALLDANNPFDLTLSAPGLYQDIDEARIPLWTIRSSVNLFDTLGPLSSGFVEGYFVPGDIDTNPGILPVLTASPYSPRGLDPQSIVSSVAGPLLNAQFVLFDHVAKRRMSKSRWGVRTQTVLNGKYTLSAWTYTTFNGQPAPVSRGIVATNTPSKLFVTETVHKLEQVYGVSGSFFIEGIDSIFRGEAEFFQNEASFVPEINLGIKPDTAKSPLSLLTNCSNNKCRDVKADILRWETGLDRFFFVRTLNPTNSFLGVLAIVGAWNLDETGHLECVSAAGQVDPNLPADSRCTNAGKFIHHTGKDFRVGQQKPGRQGTSADDYVQTKPVEVFGQIHLQTDYLHGRLTPQLTFIQNIRGTYAVTPQITYRMFDYLLFDVSMVHIGGEYQQLGFFRDRSQLNARVTYQLN